jgi:para-nitrobenzyl esterase
MNTVRYLFRDFTVALPIWKWATLQAAKSRPAYVYYFDFRDAHQPHGAPHSAEYAPVFGNLPPDASAEMRALSALIRKYWINFARSGNPNTTGAPRWTQFDARSPQVMVLDRTSGMRAWPNLEGIKALEEVTNCLPPRYR